MTKKPIRRRALHESVKPLAIRMMESSLRVVGFQRLMSKNIKHDTVKALDKVMHSYFLALGASASALERVNGKVTENRDGDIERGSLIASFILGLQLFEDAVFGGSYIQASALLRQELETITALGEIRAGKRQDGKTPNIRVLEESLRSVYSELTAVAHVARTDLMKSLTTYEGKNAVTDTITWRYFPQADTELAKRMWAIHILALLYLAEHISIHIEAALPGGYSEEESEALSLSLSILRTEGLVK